MSNAREAFMIKGLGGAKTLSGEIPVRGAKNDVLKIIAGSFLFADTVAIENVPDIRDVASLLALAETLDARVERRGRSLSITAPQESAGHLDPHLAKSLRSSVVLTGPVLARYGAVSFPHPGGCVIGARPIDLFIKAFEKMGATCRVEDGAYRITAEGGRLHGADLFLDFPSVGVTETTLMAATLAEGTTTIRNAAMEPEIQNLARFLAASGARIEGIGTPTLTIEGGSALRAAGKTYAVIPDRIEAGTFLVLAALAGDDVTITGCRPAHIRALTALLEQAGADMTIGEDTIRIRATATPYHAVNVRTHTYPGFATDLQAPMTVFLTQAMGESLVFETIFEGRLNYADDLKRMGANITMFDPHRILVRGATPLVGKELDGPDLRAGLAYVIAGIIASKESVIHAIGHIDRGYERIEERFRALGVDITRAVD